ncbi:MAG: DUF3334 family protein [Proteobacteria bacterium]|nr:DUF3334 family protein [Desulfobulbaceae bacterium]MBU4152275.1 DUF3334 family protein [Pseudomonadota bacterium]
MKNLAIDRLAIALCQATKETLEKGIGQDVTYVKTIQDIPRVSIRPDLGCFVQFYGDYNGLVAFSFSDESALYLYRNYMLTMGMPAEGLAVNATSAEVADSIGELTNQILGCAMRMVESEYDLNAKFGQPKALTLSNGITLVPEASTGVVGAGSGASAFDNRRIVFKLEESRFYLELAMEHIAFILID